MEKKLYDASVKGDLDSLHELLQEDALILDRISLTCFNETPLHIAVMRGHLSFVKQLLKLNPQLAMEVDSRKSSPLHMASVKGYVEIVEALLDVNSDMCSARDRDGRNPLHLAAMKGKVEVLKVLSQKRPDAAYEKTNRGETILHLSVKYDQLEALKILLEANIDQDFVNAKDDDGNPLLHLAVNDKQIETVKYLLKSNKIDLNETNAKGDTPLDILSQTQRDVIDLEISDTLREAGVLRATDLPQYTIDHNKSKIVKHQLPRSKSNEEENRANHDRDWLTEKRDSIMVVASLIATMAFQAAVNPTGGVWQDNQDVIDSKNNSVQVKAGESVMAFQHQRSYRYFLRANTVAFVSSLSTILLLISGLPFKNKLSLWALMVIMWLTITSIALTYGVSINAITPDDQRQHVSRCIKVGVTVWCGVMSLLLLGNTIRLLAKWQQKKNGIDFWKMFRKETPEKHGKGSEETLAIHCA